MARKRGERGVGERLERVDRFGEGVRDQSLGALHELLCRDLADVVTGREHPVGSGDDHAARAPLVRRRRLRQLLERGRDRVEDGVVERVALGRV